MNIQNKFEKAIIAKEVSFNSTELLVLANLNDEIDWIYSIINGVNKAGIIRIDESQSDKAMVVLRNTMTLLNKVTDGVMSTIEAEVEMFEPQDDREPDFNTGED